MNKYEITIITKEDEKEKPVKKEIEGLGGKILSVNSLGQRQLIFPIKKETAGYYTVVTFEIEPTKVLELNKKLGLTPAILRHIILVAKAAKIEKPKAKIEEKIKEEKKIEEPAVGPRPISPGLKKPKEAKIEKVEIPVEKPASPASLAESRRAGGPKVSAAAKAIEAEEISSEERLKALDKKLDELLKE